MDWHAQPTRVTLRYLPPGGYEARAEPAAMLQADLLGGKLAYLHAASRPKGDGSPIRRSEWRALLRMLHDQHGVLYALNERGGGYAWICTRTGKHMPVMLPGLSEAEQPG